MNQNSPMRQADIPLESGEAASNSTGYRRSLSQFATGVAVISTRAGDKLAGMTSNSFSSVSLDPPLILWSIKRNSNSFQAFEKALHFAVNILAVDQEAISSNFARSGEDKFDHVGWEPGIGGSPLLNGIVASFECETWKAVEGGDHVILIGRVVRYCRYDRAPLLFSQGRYAMVADYPGMQLISDKGLQRDVGSDADRLMGMLFLSAYKTMATMVEEARKQSGVTLEQSILLRAVKTMPGRTLEELLPEMLLGMNFGQSIFEELSKRGLVTRDGGGKLALTRAGTECIDSVLQRSLESERREMRKLSQADVAATRRVLNALIASGNASDHARAN